jgi:hypothetical protein
MRLILRGWNFIRPQLSIVFRYASLDITRRYDHGFVNSDAELQRKARPGAVGVRSIRSVAVLLGSAIAAAHHFHGYSVFPLAALR